jgi:hypothetical protein
MPDLGPPRKHSRLGLYAPFVLLLIGIVGWTAFWLYARGQAEERLDASAEQLRQGGYEIGWSERRIDGYPFRLNVTLTDARLREPSGWALEAPKLEAQALMHGLSTWVFATPEGLTFVRPVGGPVVVTGEVLRASLSHADQTPPHFSFEGSKLTFTPEAGAQPFGLTRAGKVQLHLRPGPQDQAALLFRVDEGRAQLSGLFARIAGERPISMVWESTLSRVSGFHGAGWTQAVRAWSAGGGRITVRQAGLTAGDAVVGSSGGVLAVGSDGRLEGALPVTLRQASRGLGAMAETGMIPPETAQAATAVTEAQRGAGEVARAVVTFQAGRTTLGPVGIGPAPRVY